MLVAAAVSIVTEQLRVPYTIALVIAGLAIGNLHLASPITVTPEVLLTLLIPPLLFEGGLRLPPRHLKTYGGLIGLLAVPGTILTALVIGWTVKALFHLDLRSALLLGAIVSAIDPVSVLAFLREARLDIRLGVILEGEAVLNDGVAIVLFTIIGAGATVGFMGVGLQFIWLLGGGVVVGGLVAAATAYAMGHTQQPLVEALGSLIAALGALLAANAIGASGVIAVVAAGVVFGSYGPRHLTDFGRETVSTTWAVIAFLANSMLFLLIGLEVPAALLIHHWLLILVVIGTAFAIRVIIVQAFTSIRQTRTDLFPRAWRYPLVWGGLRGGVAIALALGLDRTIPGRETIVAGAFGVVVSTLLVQGLSIRPVMRWAGLLPMARQEETSPRP
ncbi:MAG TPA: cation:proton antiporter [bacterium]|nr:cation:proton antiporter [bacterium]